MYEQHWVRTPFNRTDFLLPLALSLPGVSVYFRKRRVSTRILALLTWDRASASRIFTSRRFVCVCGVFGDGVDFGIVSVFNGFLFDGPQVSANSFNMLRKAWIARYNTVPAAPEANVFGCWLDVYIYTHHATSCRNL